MGALMPGQRAPGGLPLAPSVGRPGHVCCPVRVLLGFAFIGL